MKLLLDTTIQIDRIIGSRERIFAVEKVLRNNELYCSTYVLGEFYANIVNDLVTLFALFLIDRNIGETGKRITERIFGRSQSRVAKLYANIIDMCELNADKIEDSFYLYVDLIQNEFYTDIKEVINTTKCERANRKVIYEDDRPILSDVSCTKSKEICNVCHLWKDSEQEVDQIIKARKVNNKILDILISAKDDDREYRGRNCMTLGDMVICLETLKCHRALGVCSSNESDFQPICDSLGLELRVPDYSFKK